MPSIEIADGPFKGWRRWSQLDADSFQSLVGPVYFRAGADGSVECRSPTETKHRNNQGRLHGGYVTTFIDMALFAIAAPALTAHRAVTLTLNTEFLGAVFRAWISMRPVRSRVKPASLSSCAVS